MAKLSSYTRDTSITDKDKLAGSSYIGLVGGVPKYQTASYTIEDLTNYFSSNITIGGSEYDIAAMYADIQNNISSISSINTSITVLANEDLALAQSITNLDTQFTTDLSDAVSSINITLTSLSTADLALAESITALETSFTTDLTDAVATINTSLTALSTADSALATSITELETSFTTDLSDAVATINTELTTLSTADQALATSITELETSFTTDLSDAIATINTELTTLSTADQALATSITDLGTSFETDLSDAVATINTELTTLSTADGALATSITTLETTFTTDLATTNAAIVTEATARAEADLAEATAREELQTALSTDIATVSAAVATETLARSTEDEALAASITTLETTFTTELATTNAAIVDEATARATADLATAEIVTGLVATVGNIPLIYRQDDPPSIIETPIGSLWFDTNNNNKAYILVAGDPDNIWTIVEDTEFTQFKSDYEETITTTAELASATAEKTSRLNSVLEILDENGNLIPQNQAEYFDTITTHVDENSATASKVSNLGSAFGNFDGNTFSISEAKITEELNTYTALNFSNSTYFQGIESNIAGKPSVYRQVEQPIVSVGPPQSPANGSIWYDTGNENKVYVLTSGVWEITDDSRIGATASKLNTVTAAFGSYDVNTGFTFDGNSYYADQITTHVDTNSATAEKTNSLATQFTFDVNGDVTGTSGTLSQEIIDAESNATGAAASKVETLAANFFNGYSGDDGSFTAVAFSEAIKTQISTVVSNDGYAAAEDLNTLRITVEGEDGQSGIYGAVTSLQTTVAAKPNIFRQNEQPPITEPIGSIWYDTANNNKAYILVLGSPNTWEETRDEGLIAEIANKPFIFRQNDQPAVTNPVGSLWYDTNEGNKLYVLTAGLPNTWNATVDASIATAQETADSRPKVFRQATEPATTEPQYSIWYDTSDNNKAYVLVSSVWTETLDGRVTDLLDFVESKYSLTADANGVITGMELYSSSGPNTVRSEVKFTADKFIIQSSTYEATPFVLDNNALKLNVPLNGVSGTFSGNLFAALGTNSVVNPNAYVAFGNVEVSNIGATITKNFPVLELSDDFRAIQARRAIYINTVLNDTQEFTGIRFFGTRLDENGDEDLANKGLSIKANEMEFRYFNHPDAYVPTKLKWADKSIIGGPTYKTEIYAEWNDLDKPYIVIDADVRFQGDVDLGTGQIVGHPIINAGTSTSNAAGTSTVIKNIDLDSDGHVLDIESISLTLDNITDAGNATDNNIFVNNVIADAVIFDTANPETVLPVGGLTWDDVKDTLKLHVKEGVYYKLNQQTFFYGKATEAISKGQVVMFAGVQGSHVLLAKANMAAIGFIPEHVIGVAAEDFEINEFGHVIDFGELIGFDTTMYQEGDLLYLDPVTPGGYVTAEPPAGIGHSILIAAVINTQNTTQGGIIVRPTHKQSLNELHGVDTSNLSGGQMLAYNDVQEVWEPRDIYHIHNQGIASATWVITHNLKKYPSVTVVDSLGNVVIGDIKYTNINTVTLTFNGGFSGQAFLN